jgi:hypothetical protein
MEPIGSTYGNTASAVSPGSTPLRPEDRLRAGQDSVGNGGDAASTRKQQDPGSNRQLGVQLTGDSTRQEFRAYGPGSTSQEKASPEQSPNLESKDAPVTPPAEKKAEDPQIQQEVAQLKAIEEKVKAHEAAHKAAGGAMTGPISYSYTRGPDGRSYVTGGEVPISITPGKTPQETISRMQQVIQAALAPADPSSQDRAVAGQAAQEMQKAQQQRSETPAPDNRDATGTAPESAAASDSGQIPESTSGGASTDTSATGDRRQKTETAGIALASQAAKAYSDPSVTGKNDPSREIPASGMYQSATEPSIQGAPAQDRRQASSAMSPSMITGFGPQQLVSNYA